MKTYQESIAEKGFLFSAILSCSITLLILGFMLFMALPLIGGGQFLSLLLRPWAPLQGSYGIFPMIVGTMAISSLSILFALPLSLGCSCLISVVAPRPVAGILRRLVLLMTGIPTVIYGFVGIFLLVPVVRELFQQGSGMSVLSAAFVLAVLISPTMILFFTDSFERVPRSYLFAIDSLGADKCQKLLYGIIPWAKKGMIVGVILAFGRAMGDTLIALMIAGNSTQTPTSVLEAARTLTAHIALVMAADYESPEFRSIFTCGIVLYIFITLIVLGARHLGYRERRKNL
jgi:phosphate transport system permease protein